MPMKFYFVCLLFLISAQLRAQFIDTIYYDAENFPIEKELKAFAFEFEVRNFRSKNNQTGIVRRHNIYGWKMSEETYKNGLPDGPFTYYHRNGEIRAKGSRENGQDVGKLEEWHHTGQIKSRSEFVLLPGLGRKNKLIDAWDWNGNQMVSNGNGLYKETHELSGVLRYGNYKDGFKTGLWIEKGSDGKVISMTEYEAYGVLSNKPQAVEQFITSETEVDIEPQFPGGPAGWSKFLKKTLKYPKEALQVGAEGDVHVQFEVNVDGRIDNLLIIGSVHPALDREAMRVLRLSPNWVPARLKGQSVEREMTIQIRFKRH